MDLLPLNYKDRDIEIMQNFMSFWNNLTQLEQRFIMAISFALVLLLLFLLLWMPVSKEHDQLITKANKIKEDIAWMQTKAAVFTNSSTNVTSENKHLALKETIQRLKTQPVIRQLSAKNGETQLSIKFDKVDENELFSWLDNVQRQTSAVVTKATINADNKSGWITANLNFKELNPH